MCAIYGFLDYKGLTDNILLKRLVKALSIQAEVRGTDATGISYVNDNEVVTFKKAKPAHKVKLYFPKGTKAVIGHNRLTTQGDEKFNYNNHPFDGKTKNHSFALAHNGVLYNDKELRLSHSLPLTKIETDSYVAVQLLERSGNVDMENVKQMSELVEGSFVFTILRDDNTLFLVKGSNPITLYHFEELGLYVYASTKGILDNALKLSGFNYKKSEIDISEGEILEISPNGEITKDNFKIYHNYSLGLREYFDWYSKEEQEDFLIELCEYFGISKEDVESLRLWGYDDMEIEDMLYTDDLLEIVSEIKDMLQMERM